MKSFLTLVGCVALLGSAASSFAQTPAADEIILQINPSSGAVQFLGQNGDPGELGGYEILSDSASLNLAGRTSLASRNASFSDLGTQSNSMLSEASNSGSFTVDAAGLTLGNAFQPNGTHDVVFNYIDETGAFIENATVTYVPEPTSLGLFACVGGAALIRSRRRRS